MFKIVGLVINFIVQYFYYFFYGLVYILLIIPNIIISLFNKIFKKKLEKIMVLEKTVNFTIVGTILSVYLVGIFFLVRFYVQQERCKVFSESLIRTTEIIVNEEKQIDKTDIDNDVKANDNDSKVVNSYNDYNYDYKDFIYTNVNYYKGINNDTVGWLKVDGTNVNIAVVQAKDNDYYLKHDFRKKKSMSGWVFGDYRNNFIDLDRNTIIYGHNMADGSMFGTLVRTVNSSWYKKEKNHYIKLNTTSGKTVWQVFSVYTVDPIVDYLQVYFSNSISYGNFLDKMKYRSIYDFGVDLSLDDKILTLQTCDNSGKKRVVVQAKFIKKDS